jgi:hypothetical protein
MAQPPVLHVHQDHVARAERATGRVVVEAATAVVGLALVVAAVVADQRWLDRHFLPSFFLPRQWYVRIETIVRLAVGVVGVALAVVVRSRLARRVTRAPRLIVSVAVAVVLALVASELVLQRFHPRPIGWLVPEEEPRRQPDARLGWVLAPSRVGRGRASGRTIEYATDRAGSRVPTADTIVDAERPTIVFGGESVMFGEGLPWDETIPAQVGAMLGVQSANLAVHGYATDQVYSRLQQELPRFRRPTALVSLFMTAIFGRNLDDDRPHLDADLVWHPAAPASRLASLAALLVPYRREETVALGVSTTRAVLRATVELARARGATPLIVVPQFGAEDEAERTLRGRIVDDSIPSLFVPLDAGWRLPWHLHPNARAAHAIAAAIAARLEKRPGGPGGSDGSGR